MILLYSVTNRVDPVLITPQNVYDRSHPKRTTIKEQQVILDANIINSTIVADSGATCHFIEMNASCIKNIQKANPGINVLCPNGNFITSTYTADLTYPNLPQDSVACHIFLHLASGTLISIGKFHVAGCTINMDARTLAITRYGDTGLTGTRKPGDLWYLNEPIDSTASSDPIVSTSPYTYNVLLPTNLLSEKIKFLHAAVGYPVLSTF